MNQFELARKVADAVLYEGYVLYPYRASAVKNQFRWQFGIVAPRAWSEAGGEPWEMQTECLIEPGLIESKISPVLDVAVRFLQVRQKDGEAWEEGVERIIEIEAVPVEALPITRTFREDPICGQISLSAEKLEGMYRLRIRIENITDIEPEASRTVAMQHSLVGAHTLMSVSGGAFISLMDPPAEAKSAAAGCQNLHTWPVLVGPDDQRDVMLSSPIILQDYPAVAPESPGDMFDATEIDEILTLRVMTLTDEEKREACATDERARKIIERSDSIPPEIFERLHGAIRSLGPDAESFFNPPNEQPEQASVPVGDGQVSRGAIVRLAPKRRSDTMDFFLEGRTARVASVHRDLEDRVYVAVTVEDDPAADLHGRYGRFYYFYPDEIELMEAK